MVDRRTVDLYGKFVEELNLVTREFRNQTPVIPQSQPHFAGLAIWARALKRRIDDSMKVESYCRNILLNIFLLIGS